tara:strand:+ start:10047 stop:10700 length:654 start_codon:yes stop_codon:yes gene_type:complete
MKGMVMDDHDVLARTLYGEAKANDVDDAKAIACVVMNRVGYKNWPNTAAKVCQQAWQFSCWNTNDPNRDRILNADGPWFDACKAIAKDALAGGFYDPTRKSTHYHTRGVKPFWSKGHKPVYETAGHLYFNDIDTPAPETATEALNQMHPIGKSRTIQGATVAGVMAALGPVAGDVGKSLEQYAYLSEYIKWACAALAIIAAGYTAWARLSDRAKGVN